MDYASVDRLAKIIWDYHHVHHDVIPADVMLVLGSHDLRVAEYAADLFVKGLAPFVVVSGGIAHSDDMLATGWEKSEAEMFADVMRGRGVPEGKIVIEDTATNTGENFSLSRPLIDARAPGFVSVLVVTKPYMERRALATAQTQWPDKQFVVTSPHISFDDYVAGDIAKDDVINIMMGDLERIDVYGQRGWQTPQEIPSEVRAAFERLKSLGYTKHLLKDA